MTSLDLDQIAELLNKSERKPRATAIQHPRPVQVGPLRYNENPGACASRGCRSPTSIKIKGVVRCSTHALYELNRMIIDLSDDESVQDILTQCSCKAGNYSRQSIHTSDCNIYSRLTDADGTTT
jgi:hypothetical protein